MDEKFNMADALCTLFNLTENSWLFFYKKCKSQLEQARGSLMDKKFNMTEASCTIFNLTERA